MMGFIISVVTRLFILCEKESLTRCDTPWTFFSFQVGGKVKIITACSRREEKTRERQRKKYDTYATSRAVVTFILVCFKPYTCSLAVVAMIQFVY
jgi:hypothetical protein